MTDRQKQSSLDSTKINYFKQFWNSLTSCCRCKSVNWRKTDEKIHSRILTSVMWFEVYHCGMKQIFAVRAVYKRSLFRNVGTWRITIQDN